MHKQNQTLWYKRPARTWEESLPIGNGRMGAMLTGGVDFEKISLNHDSIWSGYIKDTTNPEAKEYLPQVRKLIEEGAYIDAEKLMKEKMLGPDTQCYLPACNLYLTYDTTGVIHDYKRALDLTTAISTTCFYDRESTADTERKEITRTYFATAVDNVMAIRLQAGNDKINVSAFFDSDIKSESQALPDGYIRLRGKCPSHVDASFEADREHAIVYDDTKETIQFQALAKVETVGGYQIAIGNKLHVYEADEVIVYLAIASSFVAFNQAPNAPISIKPMLEAVAAKGYKKIKADHIRDYQTYYNRVSFALHTPHNDHPTDERLVRCKQGEVDTGMAVLLFQYGRYLLIAASREGTQVTNLQGIWNKNMRPPWRSNLTVNINTEMNYWLVETCNLHELHKPLLDAIGEMSISGAHTAMQNYGKRGFVVHHNVDIWRLTTPVEGKPVWASWPMSAAWLCGHLWEHYVFLPDKTFLADTAYPLMKQAAEFLLDWAYIDNTGCLTTSPSTSPENSFLTADGEPCGVSKGSTMDISLMRALFGNTAAAAELLSIDSDFVSQLKTAVQKLPPLQTGARGQLLEWYMDFDESEIGHRHLSHLYGLYPGDEFFAMGKESWIDACARAIDRRVSAGSGYTGWSCAWIICLFARLKNAEQADRFINKFITNSSYLNLFCAHPPFQIDGNYGFSAGVAEMLLQSHTSIIVILPALPATWQNGHVKGLCARGGFTVSIIWKDGHANEVSIVSALDTTCRVKVNSVLQSVDGFSEQDGVFSFEAEAGKEYVFLI